MDRSNMNFDVRTGSIQSKITLWAGLCLLVTVVILVSYSVITLRQNAVANAETEALAIAEAQSENVKNQLDVPLLAARVMAASLGAVKDKFNPTPISREQVNAMLRKVLIENPAFLRTYTLWEPNAFDGRDAIFVGTSLSDNTGRFIPSWVRGDADRIHVEPLVGYETPGVGDWYLIPRTTKKETSLAPLIYPIGGKDVVMASFIVPILENGTFYGIAGVDAPISFVQQVVNKIDLYNGKTNAVLLTDAGTLISVRNRPDLSNQPATQIFPNFDSIQASIQAGQAFIRTSSDGKNLQVFSPLEIGNTGKYWSFCLIIPISEITAPATAVALRQVFLSALLIIIALLLIQFLARQIAQPVRELTNVANKISDGSFNVVANVAANDETGVLANAFNQMTSQLNNLIGSLEQRVEERTSELVVANQRNERRARQFEAIAQVARTINSTRDLDSLLVQITTVINREFGFYHVGIFLLDTAKEYAVLSAANSDGGVRMLERGHRLRVGETGLVGFATSTGRPRVALNTGADAVFFNNPDLPETHSEIALPLLAGDQVIGALDVQSTEPNAFNQEDVNTLSTLADQVSIALQNARQFEETRKALAESDALSKQFIHTGWNQFTRTQRIEGVHHTGAKSTILYKQNGKEKVEGDSEKNQLGVKGRGALLSLPVKLRGEVIGSVDVRSPENRMWEQDELDIVTAIIERSAIAMENARLLAESQKLAAKERTIGEISTKISAQSEVDELLKTAAQELGRTMPGMQISIQLKKEEAE